MFTKGKKIGGKLEPLDSQTLSTGVTSKGELYQLQITTEGVPNPQEAASLLINSLAHDFGARTYYVEISQNDIVMQIEGSPFAWTALLAALPTILLIAGVSVILIAVWGLFSSISPWVWAALAVGSIVTFVLPSMFGGKE